MVQSRDYGGSAIATSAALVARPRGSNLVVYHMPLPMSWCLLFCLCPAPPFPVDTAAMREKMFISSSALSVSVCMTGRAHAATLLSQRSNSTTHKTSVSRDLAISMGINRWIFFQLCNVGSLSSTGSPWPLLAPSPGSRCPPAHDTLVHAKGGNGTNQF